MPRLIRPLILSIPSVRRQLARIFDLEIHSQQLRETIETLNAQIAHLERQSKTLAERLASTITAEATLSASVQNQAKELRAEIETLAMDTARTAELRAQTEAINHRLAAVDAYAAQTVALEAEATQLRQSLTAVETGAAHLRQSLTAVEAAAAQAKDLEPRVVGLGTRLSAVETELPRLTLLETHIAEAREQAKAMAEEHAQLRRLLGTVANLSGKVQQLGDDLEGRVTHLEKLATASSATSAPIETSTSAVPQRSAAPALTFEQLLQPNRNGSDAPKILFFVHVPKAAGNTVTRFLSRNSFRQIELHPETNSFFHWVNDRAWFERQEDAVSAPKFVFTGHFRLDHAICREMYLQFATLSVLRNPIERMLSAYNFTLRVFHSPWHEDVTIGQMPFIDFAKNFYSAFGPQYSYFDDSGTGSLAWTGTKTHQECLDVLFTKVAFFGFTDRLDEFTAVAAYLLGLDEVAASSPANVTKDLSDKLGHPLKTYVTEQEQQILQELLRDDISFYEQARVEYERRVSIPELKIFLGQVISLMNPLRTTMHRLCAIRKAAPKWL